jgi:hypothetical protein
MQLDSDFRDWYDHAFERTGPVFKRHSNSGLSRPEMFEYLQNLGMDVPTHGSVQQVVDYYCKDPDSIEALMVRHNLLQLVVYTDERAHCGEGKILLDVRDALERYPHHFCSQYIPATAQGFGSSLRYLQVGERKWWLRYTSFDDWRSNAGDVEVQILCEEKPGYHPHIHEPMFAVDFIRSAAKAYAVDFNIAPGLEPLNGHVKASDIVSELRNALF